MRCGKSLFFCGFLVMAMGCGSVKLAPVSGRITVEGKPVAKLRVTFAPVGTAKNYAPGPASVAYTDEDGRYTLATMDKKPGAMVGTCRVRISVTDEADDPKASEPPTPRKQLPAKYNDETKLQFEVPDGGTKDANFDLTWK